MRWRWRRLSGRAADAGRAGGTGLHRQRSRPRRAALGRAAGTGPPVARAVLAAADRPVAAPSANRSGRISATSAAHVLADLDGRIDAVLDAGPTESGRIHHRRLPRRSIEAAAAGRRAARGDRAPARPPARPCGEAGHAPISPGLLASHYAPAAKVRLDADAPRDGEAWLGFGPERDGHPFSLNLSPRGDLREAASHLFGHLRQLDAAGPDDRGRPHPRGGPRRGDQRPPAPGGGASLACPSSSLHQRKI